MTEERLRQLYQQGTAAREARGGGATVVEVAPEDLLALVRGELPEERRLELFDVVMASERLRREFELLRAVERAGGPRVGTAVPAAPAAPAAAPASAPDVVPITAARSADRLRQRRPWWRSGAVPAALAAAVALAVGLSQYPQLTGAGPEVTRSIPGVADGVEPVAPEAVVAPGERPTFAWRPVSGAARYAFELVDAEGTLLHETATADTAVVLPPTVALTPGTDYRWIVRATDAAGTQRGVAVSQLRVRAD